MADQNELLTLHGRLLAGDLRAASKIVEHVIVPLIPIVSIAVGGLHDRQDVEQVCYDACLDYLEQPARYDPSRAQLITYLATIAKGKAKTLRRGQSRRSRREADYADIQAAREEIDAVGNEERLLLGIEWSKIHERFGDTLFKDLGDRELFLLMADGEKDMGSFARALGLPDDNAGRGEASKRVERMRGRIRRVAERTGA